MGCAGEGYVHPAHLSGANFLEAIVEQLSVTTSMFVSTFVQVEVSCDECRRLSHCPPLIQDCLCALYVIMSPIMPPMRVEMPKLLAIFRILSITQIACGVLITWYVNTASARDILDSGGSVEQAIVLCLSRYLCHFAIESAIQRVFVHALLQTSNVSLRTAWHVCHAVRNLLNLVRTLEGSVLNIPAKHIHHCVSPRRW